LNSKHIDTSVPGADDAARAPRTPDGRYIVVRGTLWRASNPALSDDVRERFVHELMDARRAVARARREEDVDAEVHAHDEVDRVKRALGERGDVWWTVGAPDYTRKRIAKTPYAAWWISTHRSD